MKTAQNSLSYVDRGNCVMVTDPMHEYIDEDMSDEEWQAFSEELRMRRESLSSSPHPPNSEFPPKFWPQT